MSEAPFARLGAEVAELLAGITGEVLASPRNAHHAAIQLAEAQRARDDEALTDALRDWLGHPVTAVVESGWTPTDLLEIIRRRGDDRTLPVLASLLAAEYERHREKPGVATWSDELSRLPAPYVPSLRSVRDLETVLWLAAFLAHLPSIEHLTPRSATGRIGAPESAGASSSKYLNRVRALLAKAESTQSAEEAEALSAKAQELISRYALDRLLDHPADVGATGDVAVRRIWIDAPYVSAKASLIHQVSMANRCRAVFTAKLEFMTVLGATADIDAVELMTTSLLVQAQTAMLAHGSRSDGWGTSRTRSFRRSFLIAYAGRVGERLRAAATEAVRETGDSKALVPVLKRQAAQVDAACAKLFPHLGKPRRSSVSNAEGIAAGRAAADLASLNAHKFVTARP